MITKEKKAQQQENRTTGDCQLKGATHQISKDQNAPITAAENQPITEDLIAWRWLKQYAVEMSQSMSQVITSWDKQEYLIITGFDRWRKIIDLYSFNCL